MQHVQKGRFEDDADAQMHKCTSNQSRNVLTTKDAPNCCTVIVSPPSSLRHTYRIKRRTRGWYRCRLLYWKRYISLAHNPYILCISLATSTHLLIWTCHRSQCLQWIQTSMVLAVEQTTCDRVTVLLDLPGSPLLNGRGHGVKLAPFQTSPRCVFSIEVGCFQQHS